MFDSGLSPSIAGVTEISKETRQRIIQATEALLAHQGIRGTTLRDISKASDTNLAAVNYHFGSKQALVHQVIRNRLDQLNAERLSRLDQLENHTPNVSTEAVISALIEPAIELSRREGGGRFVKILARAYAESDSELQSFLSEHYGEVMRRFARQLRTLLPELEEMELRSRINFVVGALTYAMADFGGQQRQPPAHLSALLCQFAIAGLKAKPVIPRSPGQQASEITLNSQHLRGVS